MINNMKEGFSMSFKRIIALLLTFTIVTSLLTGCAEDKGITEYDISEQASSITTQVVANNDDYSLKWDDDGKIVMLESLKTGKIWSNIPYEYYLDGGMSANVNSTINITVADNTTLQWQTVRGYSGAVSDGRVFSEKIENGIRITYCFDLFEISVPVDYVLREDSLAVTIDTQNIQESGKDYILISVSLAPFLCSASNDAEGSYLFVPTGSGALMYTTESASGTRKYSGEVYGDDVSRVVEDPYLYNEAIRLPVYGVKAGENALLGIIEQGAPSATIEAEAGNSRNGYSTVYSTFYYRGYEKYRTGTYAMGNGLVTRSSDMVNQGKFTVGFYPLYDTDADYNGMAKRYKQYLIDSGLAYETKQKQNAYSITLLGGTKTTSSVMGIPTKTLKSMTTFLAAEDIIKNLTDVTSTTPTVRLVGFGNSGILEGEIAGGYEFDKVFGSKKDHASLEEYCEDNSITLFTDFDLIKFSKSGNGFSYSGNSAKNAMSKLSTLYNISPIRMNNTDLSYRLLARDEISNALDKLLKKSSKLNVSAVSLSTIGRFSYSDYDSEEYAVKNKIDTDINKMLANAHDSKLPIAVASANVYAASVADTIFDVPTQNGGYNAFDESIPFYQLVFQNDKPMYTSAINLADNPDKQIMLAASTGIGLGFTLIDNFDVTYTELTGEELYGMVYSDNKVFIKDTLENYLKVYNKINGSNIERYEILENGVSKTLFDNGIVVYANHTELEAQSPVGVLAPYQFKSE